MLLHILKVRDISRREKKERKRETISRFRKKNNTLYTLYHKQEKRKKRMNDNNKRLRELEDENARLRAKIQKLEKLHTEEDLNSAKRVTYRYVPPTTSKPEKPKNVRIQTLISHLEKNTHTHI